MDEQSTQSGLSTEDLFPGCSTGLDLLQSCLEDAEVPL